MTAGSQFIKTLSFDNCFVHKIAGCRKNGRYEFDFMRGDEEYKYRFGGVNRFVMRARVYKV